ncbi:MAG: hypothetical protein LPK02_11295, partial [Rhodobacterales bacterium]|nr:hypothetical protein [Rhodobacterales bacterium]
MTNIRTKSGTVSAVALVVGLAVAPHPLTAQETGVTPPQDFSGIVAELSPAVVGITARGVRAPRSPMPGPGMPGPFGQMP